MSASRHYCTLCLRSDWKETPSTLLVPSAVRTLGVEDHQSPPNLDRAHRLRAAGFVQRADLPRYAWYLDSREAVGTDESDPLVHVSWLLSQLKPHLLLADAQRRGVEASLDFHWGGSGTGGGPFLSPKLAELLLRHNIGLTVGFYYEEVPNAA